MNRLAIVVLVLAALSVRTMAITNGSFESDLDAWNSSGNLGVGVAPEYPPVEGTKTLVFNWGNTAPNGTVSQVLNTEPGHIYALDFSMGVKAFNTSAQRLRVTVTGAATLLDQTLSLSRTGNATITWSAHSLVFTADSAATILTFKDVSTATNSIDLLLDYIRVASVAQPLRTLTIASAPSAVNIAASPTDDDGNGGGATLFTRVYAEGTQVSLTAPMASGSYSFEKWLKDGVDFSTNPTLSITIDLDHTFLAVYKAGSAASIVNGSFESAFDGWITSGNVALGEAPGYVAIDGSKALVFNGGQSTPTGVVYQTIATRPGAVYSLDFAMGVLAFNTSTQRLRVTAIGGATLIDQTLSLARSADGTLRWVDQSLAFTADSANTTLTFADVSTVTNNIDLLIDKVRVTPAVTLGTMAVASSPNGVTINVTPLDEDGAGGGITPFTRLFRSGSTVTLSAPTFSTTNSFLKWEKDGADYSTNPVISVTPESDHSFNAVYASTPAVGLANGSFEAALAGWTSSGNIEIRTTAADQTTDGITSVAFNAGQTTPNGTLSQAFATTPGLGYSVQFDVGVLAYNTREQRLQVSIEGGGPAASQVFSVFGVGGGLSRWEARTVTFSADSATTTLTFRDLSPTTDAVDLLLDNVRITNSDYYGGQTPTLVIVGGNNQIAERGSFNAEPFDLAVFNAAGTLPLVAAPVTFEVIQGGGLLAETKSGHPTTVSKLTLLADEDGSVQVYYQHPPIAGVLSNIRASAGAASVVLASSTALGNPDDVDADGLNDAWETEHFGGTNAIATADPDNDGLTNLQEFMIGSDPNKADTDGDGMSDGAEHAGGRDPLNSLDGAPLPIGVHVVLPTANGEYFGINTTTWAILRLTVPAP